MDGGAHTHMVRLTQPLLSRSATQSGDEEEESEQQLCMVDKPASAVDTAQTMIIYKAVVG